MSLLVKIYNKSNKRLAIIASIVFIVFISTVLPYINYLSAEVWGMTVSPDTNFAFQLDTYYHARLIYGETGRRMYVVLRFTFDVIWPAVYSFFYFMVIAYFSKKLEIRDGYKLLLVVLLAVLFDLFENVTAVSFMLLFPAKVDMLVYILMIGSMLKWVFVIGSFVVIIILLVMYIVRKVVKK